MRIVVRSAVVCFAILHLLTPARAERGTPATIQGPPLDIPSQCSQVDFATRIRGNRFVDSLRRLGTLSTLPAVYPLCIWPLANALHDRLVITGYVDDDTTSVVADYQALPHSYNGHQGTDIALLSFHEMDEGFPVIASAAGVVTFEAHHYADRNFIPGPPDSVNWVVILHADGTAAGYLHLRKNSTTVKVGESVLPGDTLGLVGSSGMSTGPHLHFELRDSTLLNSRDPWNGPNQPLPSLWVSQEPYVGTAPVRPYELDVFTQIAAGGNMASIPVERFFERLTAPAVFGADETYLGVWAVLQGRALDTVTIRVRRPDNSVFSDSDYVLPFKIKFGWRYWYWNFSGNVAPADYGTWIAETEVGGVVVNQRPFEVGASTIYRPRFAPLSGRSLRYEGAVLRDTLRIDSLGSLPTYSLLNAPEFVSIEEDTVVVTNTPCSMTSRSVYFQAIATDAGGRTDTMWYHLVDEARPACFTDDDGDGWGDPNDDGIAQTGGSCSAGLASNNCDNCLAFGTPGNVDIMTGDANANGTITSADIIYAVNYVFKGGPSPLPCAGSADVNCSGSVTSADIIYSVNYVFKGGAPPCAVCNMAPGSSSLCP